MHGEENTPGFVISVTQKTKNTFIIVIEKVALVELCIIKISKDLIHNSNLQTPVSFIVMHFVTRLFKTNDRFTLSYI